MVFLLNHERIARTGAKDRYGRYMLRTLKDSRGRSLLYHIVLSGEVKVLINDEDNSGQTPLSIAVQTGHLSLTDSLLELGANSKTRGGFGRTALHDACEGEQPNLAVCEMLLAKGAQANAKCNRGFVPSQVAFGAGFLEGNVADIGWLLKPYVLVSSAGEAKVLYPAGDVHGANPDWNQVQFFSHWFNLESTKFDIELFDAGYRNRQLEGQNLVRDAYWKVKYVTVDGALISDEEGYVTDVTFMRRLDGLVRVWPPVCVDLEVTLPPELKGVTKMNLRGGKFPPLRY
ncbi:ankyrin repeat domain-containing protein [Aspergillus stella-maris]|uniref:ankyrin repeat domain-containing protein n=1 Tax=Aspergillus stella-maris TaxID=1810926 RepID=UPI003CCD8F17